MCLLRLPRITQPLEKEEEEMMALMGQIELEKSHYSDHEIRKLEEEERLKRRKESLYDDDDDEVTGKTVIMAQDLEDKWEQKFLRFKPASRITDADKKNIRTSLNRKLDSNLMLLVKQKIGNQELWLLPQAEWQPGETLRSTAERAMATFLVKLLATCWEKAFHGRGMELSGADFSGKMQGNRLCTAACGGLAESCELRSLDATSSKQCQVI
ncbi:39S ribosomal protein L46, mitochondrial isoform X2 [Manacus vitellinus]|uniref:39S ribosomal protein L46, mitochondrial isoform X2 n=1 Tax=Manacus vitellinus TaxID=328815 RepID=UPI000847A360|nr:39S ribosomal protein L46, mitochondrial isoform X2 [Manacus vitellinus]